MQLTISVQTHYGAIVSEDHTKVIHCPVLPPIGTELLLDGLEVVIKDIIIDIDSQTIHVRCEDNYLDYVNMSEDLKWHKENKWIRE